MSIYTDFITDARLIAAAHPSHSRANDTGKRRVSQAIYADGHIAYFAVGSCGHNQIFAREYGTRIRRSALLSCKWVKDASEVEA